MENKKKLVYVLHDIAMGGVEVALVSAIPSLCRQYHLKVIVLGKVEEHLVQGLTDEQKAVFECFNYPFYQYPAKISNVVSAIQRFNPEIIICSLWRASLVGVLVKALNRNIKFISFNHSTRFPHKLSAFFTWAAAKSADVVLTDGFATKAFVETKLSPKVPVRTVSFLTHETPEFIERTLPVNGAIKFMFLGRINKVKNLPLIIEAIHCLNKEGIEAQLDIYGRNDGNMQDAETLISAYNLQGKVTFKGEVLAEERNAIFSKYHFYIQLSSFEGMAMSVAEAMQHGLVCVVSPVGEIVHYAKDMESAIFINIFNKEHWKKDLSKISYIAKNQAIYDKISHNCHSNFLNKPQYAASLITQIEQA